jgi:hypothetical protein
VQKLPSQSTPRHHPALLGDQICVSCLNVGGEFFVGEAGIFGVRCFCHRLRMSVAKFCEVLYKFMIVTLIPHLGTTTDVLTDKRYVYTHFVAFRRTRRKSW